LDIPDILKVFLSLKECDGLAMMVSTMATAHITVIHSTMHTSVLTTVTHNSVQCGVAFRVTCTMAHMAGGKNSE
jgi:hypothetical protein